MSALSDYLEEELLDHILRNAAYTSPTTVYVGLFVSDPTDAATGTEVSGGAYARQSVAFDAPITDGVGKLSDNTSDITFPTATANWGTITHMALFDAVSGGNMLVHGELAASKVINTNDIFKFLAGDLDVKLS